MDLKELRNKLGELLNASRAILDKAKTDKRVLNAEETAAYDKLVGELTDVKATIQREERQQEIERETAVQNFNDPGNGADNAGNDDIATQAMNAFRNFLVTGGVGDVSREVRNALQQGSDGKGGYLVPPETFIKALIKAIDDQVFIRGLSTVIPLSGVDGIGVPSLDSDIGDWDWTTELATGSEDSAMGLGKRSMESNPVAKRIKISQDLMNSSAIPVEVLVMSRLAYKLGVTQEKAYMTGNGAKQPLGLFVASNSGIPASRDISEEMGATALTANGVINVKYGLKAAYWNDAQWLWHRDAMKQLVKLKTTDGQYIYRESLQSGEPDKLLGMPLNISEFVPNTFTTGQYVGMLGAFKHYWIIDSLAMRIQRLNELYAETNQIGFIGRYKGDAMPVLPEAFARVKLG